MNCKTTNHNAPTKAFTLIELLIVIAIIAILASILFPVFGRARENARRATCQSNLKQISLGILQYVQDYDERFPKIVAVPGESAGWADRIGPYLKSPQIFKCPTFSGNATQNNNPYAAGYTTYWFSRSIDDPNSPGGGMMQAAISMPAVTVLNGDGGNTSPHTTAAFNCNGCSANGSPPGTALATICGAPGTVTNLTAGGQQHFDGLNLSFADGHVKWFKSTSTQTSSVIYNGRTGYTTTTPFSGDHPTFNVLTQ